MSDQIMTLVVNVNDSLLKRTTENIQHYLFSKDIIKNEKAENVYRGDGFGFVPGGNINQFSDEDPDDYGMNDLTTNGVAFIAERRAFHDYSDLIALKCPACSTKTSVTSEEDVAAFWRKVNAYDKGQVVRLKCPSCDAEQEIDQYDYNGQLAFGNVGVEFYNWPPISDSCKRQLEEIINSKIEVVYSRL